MFCRYCGSEVSDNAKFCSKCGSNVERKNTDAKRINRQDETTYNTFPQQPSQTPPQQPSRQYIPPRQSPNQPPAGGGGSKRPGGRSALIIILSIALVAGLCVNMFQFVNGTHILSRHSSQISYYKTPDASLVSDADEWGAVPLNQLIIVFDDDVGKSEAKKIIQQLGGVIVGEIEMINLYQIETEGRTETELARLLETTLAMSGVETAFPNVEVYGKDAEGTPCTPLRDPLYTAPDNSSHYKAIGMENAWRIIKSSGVKLNKVNAGVLDSSLYTGSNEYKGKVNVIGDKTDVPEKDVKNQIVNGGLNHGTMVTNVIGADHENDGMVGIASVLGDKLSINIKNLYDGKKSQQTDYDEDDITQASYTENGMNYTYTMKALVYLKEQVESGATVINCSYGPAFPRDQHQWVSKAYEKFFKEIYKSHPNVIFVAAAGNEGRDPLSKGALNGSNYYPAGMKLPNVITVGALNNDGTRAEFSNYAASENAEVTLSAPGVEMLLGVNENGQPIKASGTSFCAPQVSAAIALIQSISPGMDASQIKDLLVQTAAGSVSTESGSTPIPEGMGKGVLRVDEAVLQAINSEREKQGESPYTMQELLDRSTVNLFAETGFREYTVRASVPDAESASVSLKIEVTGKCSIEDDTVQTVQVGEDAVWNLTIEDDSVFVRVVRTDTEGCAFMTLKIYESVSGIYEVKGVWDSGDGPEPLTDWRAQVEDTGDGKMTITFYNSAGTVLTGNYDEITGVFVGIDRNKPADIWAFTWWMGADTTITFDFDSMPMMAKGTLTYDWHATATVDGSDPIDVNLSPPTKVDFEMLKVEELPQ